MQRVFWGHINGFLNRPISTRWTSQIAITPWIPWFVPENRAQIKGGLLYGPMISKSIWASGFNPTIWPILYLSPGPKPPLGLLNEWSSLIHTMLHLLDHIQWSASQTRKWLLGRITSRLLGSVWGVSLPSISTEVGTILKATLTTPHSHLNIYLQLMILDLPLH